MSTKTETQKALSTFPQPVNPKLGLSFLSDEVFAWFLENQDTVRRALESHDARWWRRWKILRGGSLKGPQNFEEYAKQKAKAALALTKGEQMYAAIQFGLAFINAPLFFNAVIEGRFILAGFSLGAFVFCFLLGLQGLRDDRH